MEKVKKLKKGKKEERGKTKWEIEKCGKKEFWEKLKNETLEKLNEECRKKNER